MRRKMTGSWTSPSRARRRWGGRVGEEKIFAYIFSELLAREISKLGKGEFTHFLAAAHAKDAGQAGCRQVYGFGLEVWVAKLLGEGNWAPLDEPEIVEEVDLSVD